MSTTLTKENIRELLSPYSYKEKRRIRYDKELDFLYVIPTCFNKVYSVEKYNWKEDKTQLKEIHRQEVYEALAELHQLKPVDITNSRKINSITHKVRINLSDSNIPGQLEVFVVFKSIARQISPKINKLIDEYTSYTYSLGFIPNFCEEIKRVYKESDHIREGKIIEVTLDKKNKWIARICFPLFAPFTLQNKFKIEDDDRFYLKKKRKIRGSLKLC